MIGSVPSYIIFKLLIVEGELLQRLHSRNVNAIQLKEFTCQINRCVSLWMPHRPIADSWMGREARKESRCVNGLVLSRVG